MTEPSGATFTPLRGRWRAVAIMSLSAAASIHFLVGAALWMGAAGNGVIDGDYVWRVGWPCFALLGLSLLSFAAAVRRWRGAIPLVLLTLGLSAAAFWYDVSHERWQWRVVIATVEYLASHPGRPETYLTWWWY